MFGIVLVDFAVCFEMQIFVRQCILCFDNALICFLLLWND